MPENCRRIKTHLLVNSGIFINVYIFSTFVPHIGFVYCFKSLCISGCDVNIAIESWAELFVFKLLFIEQVNK